MHRVIDFLTALSPVAQGLSAVVAALTVLVGLGTLWKSLREYNKSNALKRFEKFQDMRVKFDSGMIAKIRDLIGQEDKTELEKISIADKERFMAFYEEIALMNQSKLLSNNIAFYMFGYYALEAFRSPEFVKGVNMKSIYWSLFVSFCERAGRWDKKCRAGEIDLPNKVREFHF